MMQATKSRHGHDATSYVGVLPCFATGRSFLRQRKMRSVIVVVTDVVSDQAFQMSFTYNDHMVQQIPAAVADPTLGNTILPRTSEAGSLGLNAEALNCFDHFATEVCTAIKDQVSGGSIEWECLAQLLNDPNAGWMFGRVAVDNPPPVMRNDEEAIQHAESQRRHGEEIHRCDGLTMVAQKRTPSFCRLGIARRLSHPTCHRTTVSSWTRINACFHPGQSRRNIIQNNLSEAQNRG
jgi:hypothetical protein